jgi:hypothetical protein
MLTTIIRALRWTDEKLENLLADLAANYARELLAAHGLVEIEIDHIRRNSKIEPIVEPTESEKIRRSTPSKKAMLYQGRPEIVPVETAADPTEEVGSLRAPTPDCALWSGPEVVATLCVAGAAIVALLFCLTAIFKS